MASHLTVSSARSRELLRERAKQNTPLQRIKINSPFLGHVPDIDPFHLGGNASNPIENLLPKFDRSGLGEVLTHPDGWSEVDTARLPLGVPPLPSSAGRHVNLLSFFARTNNAGARTGEYDFTVMAATDGDGSTAGSSDIFRLKPSNGQWEEVAASAHVSNIAAEAAYPDETNNSQLFDSAVFPAGVKAADRSGLTAGPVGEPAFVFTNGIDPVYIYPVDAVSTESGDYEILTDVWGTTSNAFKATSVESWGDRLNFLNTEESNVRHRQRLRRTPIGTAEPNTDAGSGVIDFREFSEDGLRVLGLGDLLTCWFGDGVAAVRRSGNPDAPYQRQIVTTKRGILSKQSVTSIGGNELFAICTDGWFFLDQSLRWREAGVTSINNVQVTKWKQTFYDRLDLDLRERLFVHYDQINRLIFISAPFDNQSENEEVWIYDPRGDRVFIQTYPATVYAQANITIQSVTTIGALPGTIGGLDRSIGAYGAKFGTKSTLHGTRNGLVMKHDPDITSRIDISSRTAVEPTYKHRSILSSLGDPRNFKVGDQVLVEQVKRSEAATMVATLFCNSSPGSQSATLDLSVGTVGDVISPSRYFTFSSPQMGIELTGQGPVAIRSVEIDAFTYGVEPLQAP